MVVGISSGGKEAPVDGVTKEVKSVVDKAASYYKRKTEGDSKAILKGYDRKNTRNMRCALS